MRKVRNAIAGVLLLGTALGTAGNAHAATGMEVALQDDAVFLYRSYYDRDTAFQQARALGVTRLRVNVLWDRALGAQARLAHRPRSSSTTGRPTTRWSTRPPLTASASS